VPPRVPDADNVAPPWTTRSDHLRRWSAGNRPRSCAVTVPLTRVLPSRRRQPDLASMPRPGPWINPVRLPASAYTLPPADRERHGSGVDKPAVARVTLWQRHLAPHRRSAGPPAPSAPLVACRQCRVPSGAWMSPCCSPSGDQHTSPFCERSCLVADTAAELPAEAQRAPAMKLAVATSRGSTKLPRYHRPAWPDDHAGRIDR